APQRQPVGHDSRRLTRRAQTKPVIARPAKRAEAISQRRQSVVEAVGGIRARAGFGAGLAWQPWLGAARSNEACHCEARASGPKQSRNAGRAWPKPWAGFALARGLARGSQ